MQQAGWFQLLCNFTEVEVPEAIGHGIHLALWHTFICSIDVPSFSSLDRLGTGDDIPRCKILRGRSVSFHESLSFAVDEKSALSSTSFRHQTSGTIDSSQIKAIRAAFVIQFPQMIIWNCDPLKSFTLVQFSNLEPFESYKEMEDSGVP